MEKVRVVENPISHKMLVVLSRGSMTDLARTAATVARQYPDRPVEASMDFGATVVLVTAEERQGKNFTAVDWMGRIAGARGMATPAWLFNSALGDGGVFGAEFSESAPMTVGLFEAALDAALLSRQYKAPVEFEFRGRTVKVDGNSDPEAIEQSFPENLRRRADSEPPPPRQWYSVKDQFNVEATAEGFSAAYKDPVEGQKHIYYIGQDLVNLSHEFNDRPVTYYHAGQTLTVSSEDEPLDIQKRVPERLQWIGQYRR